MELLKSIEVQSNSVLSLTVFVAITIAILTLSPIEQFGPAGSDKIFHALAFAALAFPLSVVRPRYALWVVFGVFAYGGMIQLIQPHVGRTADVWDLLADLGGAAIGGTLGMGVGKVWSAGLKLHGFLR